MKIKLVLMGAAAAAITCSGVALAATIGINKPAPNFSAVDVQGKPQSLAQYRGKIVVVEWIDPECGYDNKHYKAGNLPALQKQAKADGVVWISVNSAGKGLQGDFSGKQLDAWLKSNNWTGAAYIRDQEGKIGQSFRATATPGMYIIDKEGNLRYSGALDSIPSQEVSDIPKATNYVKQALLELKAGKPVSKPVTRAYGCTVKYGSVIGG